MKRSRFSDEQIISILKEHQVGMEVSDAKRLEALEAENATSVSPDYWTGSRNSGAIPAWWSATMGPS